jgi:hypothetical protein
MILRHITGMELPYLDERLAKPMGWGAWGTRSRNGATIPHARRRHRGSTDALRFAPAAAAWTLATSNWSSRLRRALQPAIGTTRTRRSVMFEVMPTGT